MWARGTAVHGRLHRWRRLTSALVEPTPRAASFVGHSGASVAAVKVDRRDSHTWHCSARARRTVGHVFTACAMEAGPVCMQQQRRGHATVWQQMVAQSPPRLRHYLHLVRLDKPAGTYLLFWPCAWGIGMASAPHLADPSLLALFACGSLVMRGAGCIINDMWDARIDAEVDRTKSRPLASGAISYPQATACLAGNLTLGLGVVTQLESTAIMLAFSAVPLVVVYPYMKRITFWPQAFLGMTFNFGALVGWAAVGGTVNWAAALPLYAAGGAWTMVYDTIYAHQDKVDDSRVGVKSTALRFGDKTPQWLTFFSMTTVGSLSLAGSAAEMGLPYFASVGAVAAHLLWQVSTVDYNNPVDCLKKFQSNFYIGAMVFCGIELDAFSAAYT